MTARNSAECGPCRTRTASSSDGGCRCRRPRAPWPVSKRGAGRGAAAAFRRRRAICIISLAWQNHFGDEEKKNKRRKQNTKEQQDQQKHEHNTKQNSSIALNKTSITLKHIGIAQQQKLAYTSRLKMHPHSVHLNFTMDAYDLCVRLGGFGSMENTPTDLKLCAGCGGTAPSVADENWNSSPA